MSSVMVKNRVGTSGLKCVPCGSWLDHYKKKNGSVPAHCVEANCVQKPTVGAHVYQEGSKDTFIVPFCDSHNKELGYISVLVAYLRVSAKAC